MGEIILIARIPAEVELMAALQVAVSMVGGQSLIVLSISDADKGALVETSIEHLSRKPISVAQSVNAVRTVELGQTGGIPTKEYAESRGADFDAVREMFWNVVQVFPAELARSAEVVAGYLQEGTQLRLTSEAGTDLSFSLADVAPRINAGRTADVLQATGPSSVWIPAIEAYSPVDTGSADGNVLVTNGELQIESRQST